MAVGLAWLGALAGASAAARPVTLDDLMRREAFGSAQVAPGGRWLVIERRGPYRSASRFDLEGLNDIARTRLERVDLARPGPGRPLLAAAPGVGYAAGPISPDGRRMAVFRLTDRRWELGVVTLADRKVRWLGLTPDLPNFSRPLQWLSGEAMVVIARPDGDLPFTLRWRRNAALQLPARWARSARGLGAATVVGSGRYLGVRPQPGLRRLVRLDVRSGRRRVLASGSIIDMEVSPGAAHIALITTDGDAPMSPDHPVQGPYGFERLRHRLSLLDPASGARSAPCPGCDVLMSPLAWSPRGEALLLFARRDGEPWPAGHLLRLDAATGAMRRTDNGEVVPQMQTRPEAARAAWLGGDPIVWAAPAGAAATGRADWYRLGAAGPAALTGALAAPTRDAVTVSVDALLTAADGQAWRIAADGRATAIADGFAPLRRAPATTNDRADYTVARDEALPGLDPRPGREAVLSVTAGAAPDRLPLSPGAEVLAQAPGLAGVLVRTRPSGGEEQLSWIARDGATHRLATINRRLADLDAPDVRPIAHRGPGGAPLTSWLLLPPARPPGTRAPPLVVWPYLGDRYATAPRIADLRGGNLNEMPALLAAHGYAVLLPSLPTRTDGADPVEGLAARVLAIVDAAAQDPALQALFDATRLGVWGHSYGGYTTLAMLTQTPRFKAAVAYAAPSDLFSLWGEFQPSLRVDPSEGLSPPYAAGWTEDLQGAMHAPPWADPQRYLRNSPAWRAGAITTPLLIFHGDQDSIPLGQAEEMFSGLLRQNKDALLVTYWGEGHVVRSPGNLRDLYARGFAWLDRYLLDDGVTRDSAEPPRSPARGPASDGPRTRPRPR
jgi:dipeptidyl aminopeptidase/acylaminoacyl peptidase